MTEIPDDAEFAIKLSRGTGIRDGWDGLVRNNTLGAYAHLEASSYKEFAASFVDSAIRYRGNKE